MGWTWKPLISLLICYIFHGRSLQRGLEWDAVEVLTFKGADKLAAVCVTEWEISQLGPAGVTGRFAWTGFGSNSKSSNQKIPALFCLAKKVGIDHDTPTESKMPSVPTQIRG